MFATTPPRATPSTPSKLANGLACAAGVALLVPNWWLLRFRLRRRVDGWRRGAGLILRGEGATFVLSAFGLDSGSGASGALAPGDVQQHVATRLAEFLAGETELHRCVRRGQLEDRGESCAGPSYTLGFEPWIDGPARFVRPAAWQGADCSAAKSGEPTLPLLNIVCRISAVGVVDVWMRINHVGIDGVPVQETLSRLQAKWGMRESVFFPAPEEFTPHAGPRPCPGRTDAAEVQMFIDFTPLLEWRKRINESLPEPLTVSAALTWRLAQHPAFADRFIGSTVEVRPKRGLGRAVNVLVVRPSDFASREDGLAHYGRHFNRQVYLARGRRTAGCKTLDAGALIPARLELALLHNAMKKGGKDFGSMGLSIIKDAEVFGAPLADVGHPDGFLAIGRMNLPTKDGGRVGCVTIKGPQDRIADYPRYLREVMDACADSRITRDAMALST